MRERGEVEREYARALRKLVARYSIRAPGNYDMIMMIYNNNDEIDDDS